MGHRLVAKVSVDQSAEVSAATGRTLMGGFVICAIPNSKILGFAQGSITAAKLMLFAGNVECRWEPTGVECITNRQMYNSEIPHVLVPIMNYWIINAGNGTLSRRTWMMVVF